MKEKELRFPSGGLSLEGILGMPDGAGPFPAVVVCHPHPLYGGSMDNNVVAGIHEALIKAAVVSFKFNFRGVGGSAGEHSHGDGEQKDVAAAISFLIGVREIDKGKIGLAGYSAGAGFAFPVGTRDARVQALAAVSPPLSMFDFTSLKDCHKPKLLICGSRDNIITASQFTRFCHDLPEPKQCEIIEGADHFWQGYESRLAGEVASFFTRTLQ